MDHFRKEGYWRLYRMWLAADIFLAKAYPVALFVLGFAVLFFVDYWIKQGMLSFSEFIPRAFPSLDWNPEEQEWFAWYFSGWPQLTVSLCYLLWASVYLRRGLKYMLGVDEEALRSVVEKGIRIRSRPLNLYQYMEESDRDMVLAARMHPQRPFLVHFGTDEQKRHELEKLVKDLSRRDKESLLELVNLYQVSEHQAEELKKKIEDQAASMQEAVIQRCLTFIKDHYSRPKNEAEEIEHKFNLRMNISLTILGDAIKQVSVFESDLYTRRQRVIDEVSASTLHVMLKKRGGLCFPVCDLSKKEGLTLIVSEDVLDMPPDQMEVLFLRSLLFVLQAKFARSLYISLYRLKETRKSNKQKQKETGEEQITYSFWYWLLLPLYWRSIAMLRKLSRLSSHYAREFYINREPMSSEYFEAREMQIRREQWFKEFFSVTEDMHVNPAKLFEQHAKNQTINFNQYPGFFKRLLTFKVKDVSPRDKSVIVEDEYMAQEPMKPKPDALPPTPQAQPNPFAPTGQPNPTPPGAGIPGNGQPPMVRQKHWVEKLDDWMDKPLISWPWKRKPATEGGQS